jgi:integrase
VPADLLHLYPSIDAYRASLRTRDRAEAVTKAYALLAQYRETFDHQRAAEAVRRAPPVVPLTPEIEAYLIAEARWLPLVFDDLVRFTPGTIEAMTPGTRFLTADNPEPLWTGDDPAKWDRLQQHALNEAKGDLAAGRLERIQQAAETALQGLGVRIDWADSKARLALVRIGRATVRAHLQALERGQGEPHDTPAKPLPPVVAKAPASPEPPSETLRDVMPDWIARTKAKQNAQQRARKALDLWEDAVGRVPLVKVSRATGAAFVAFLLDPARPFGSSTAANHAAAINALINIAAKVGKIERNPLDLSFKVEDAERRHPWTTEELSTIFTASLFSDNPGPQPYDVEPEDARLWLWLLLWSGARAGEIAQLRVEDVQSRDGVLCLHVTPEAGTVKTSESTRWLPVAQALCPLLRSHVEARKAQGEAVLFPSFQRRPKTSPADLATKWFLKFRADAGLPSGPLNGSHRFRHSVRTRLAELGVSPDLGDQLTGHAATGSTGRRVYTGTVRVSVLADVVERLGWEWPRSPRA